MAKKKSSRKRTKKKRFIKYWYSPDDPRFADYATDRLRQTGRSFRDDVEQTSENIAHAPGSLSDRLSNALQKAKKSAGYIKETPNRWNKDLERRVERERQKNEEINRPMSPEEYQQAVERYNEAFGIEEEAPMPEYPPVNPEQEQDLYRNTRPTPPYMPENPPPVLTEEQFMKLPPNQQMYYRKGKSKKMKRQKHSREPFRYVKEMPKEKDDSIRYLRTGKKKKAKKRRKK